MEITNERRAELVENSADPRIDLLLTDVCSIDYHFLHVSKHEPTMVAYYKDKESAINNKSIRTKAGRYLNKFYGNHFTEQQIRDRAEMYVESVNGFELVITDDGEEIVDVYRNSAIRSCMANEGSYPTPYRDKVVEVYGGPDTGLAYLKTSRGRIVARAVVSTTSNTYCTVYTHTGYHSIMVKKLKENGFSRVNNYEFLEGDRLLKIKSPSKDYAYKLPYLDSELEVYDNGEYLKVGYGEYLVCDQQTRNGYTTLRDEEEYCSCCDENYSADDVRYVEGYGSVCDCCCDEHFHWSEYSSEYIHEDNCIFDVHGNAYDQSYHDLVYCDREGEYYPEDEVVETHNGDYIPEDEAITVLEYASRDEMVFHEDDIKDSGEYFYVEEDGEVVYSEEDDIELESFKSYWIKSMRAYFKTKQPHITGEWSPYSEFFYIFKNIYPNRYYYKIRVPSIKGNYRTELYRENTRLSLRSLAA